MTRTPHPTPTPSLGAGRVGVPLTLSAALLLAPTPQAMAQSAADGLTPPSDEAVDQTPAQSAVEPVPEAAKAPEAAPASAPTAAPASAPTAAPAPAPKPAPSTTSGAQILGVPASAPASNVPGGGILGLPGKSAPAPSPAGGEGAQPPPPGSNQAGVPILMTAVGGWSAYTLGSIGALGRNAEIGVPMGVATGALVGAGSTYLLTRGREVDQRRAAAIVNAEAWGTSIGWLATAAQADALDNAGRTGAVYGALGMGAGLLYGALNKEADFRGINLGGLSGSMGALGLSLLVDVEGSDQALAMTGASAALGLGEMGLGILMDRDEPMSAGDGALAAHLSAHTVWMGLWAPGLFVSDPDAEGRWGGALLGGSLALTAAQAVSPWVEPSAQALNAASLAGTYGYLAGGGVPLLAGKIGDTTDGVSDGYWASLGVIGGGVTGLGLGAIRGKVREDDTVGLAHLAGSGVGLAHGLVIGNAFKSAGDFDTDQYLGLALTSTGVGGMLGLMAPPRSDEPGSGIKPWAAATGFGWGAWFGGWGAAAAGLERPWVLTGGMLAADLGGGLGLLATRSGREMTARNLGYVSLCGVGGAAIANVITLAATDDPQAIAVANLAGGGAGLLTGVLSRGLLDNLMGDARHMPRLNLPSPLANVGREAARWSPRLEVAPLPIVGARADEALPMGALLSLTQPVR